MVARSAKNSTIPRNVAAFTLIELLGVVAIIAVLAGIAVVNYQRSQTRANVSATLNNIRQVTAGMEIYFMDWGVYPVPAPSFWDDPFGVVADSAVSTLTTPIAYVSAEAFSDPFGSAIFESSVGGTDMFGMPIPTFNSTQSLLIFFYPSVARLVNRPAMDRNGYALVSLGPDGRDSFVVYYPFPGELPVLAEQYGVFDIQDTLYDPTNGTISSGDIAGFGGELTAPRLRGGGL